MPRIKDQAICIRLIDWSETSQVVALLCREQGKMRGLAKGSKRLSPGAIARFSGGIELLTQGEVVAITKAGAELANITEWNLQQPWYHLRESYQAQQLGLYAADVVHAMLPDLDPAPDVFDALLACLTQLAEPDQRQAALLTFQWRLLQATGYQPRLDQDIRTGQPLPRQAAYLFDPQQGGLTADLAGHRDQAGEMQAGPWRVRQQTIDLLSRLTPPTPPPPPTPPISPGPSAHPVSADALQRANRLLCVYLRSILDRQLPTMTAIL